MPLGPAGRCSWADGVANLGPWSHAIPTMQEEEEEALVTRLVFTRGWSSQNQGAT